MKVCIIGAGAIGGFIGTKLAVAGRADVCALARGATLTALRDRGWRLRTAESLTQAPARASDNAAELGVQDVVMIAVKGPALAGVAATIAPLLGPDTMVVPAMNGVPWWFCAGLPGVGDAPLSSLDPGGAIARAIALRHVVGCVVHASTSTPEPGLVLHRMGQGLIVGEPAGGQSERVQRLAFLLAHAGFDTTHSPDVRHDIWYKLWGNLTVNPVSALTGATTDRILADPELLDFCTAAMHEAAAIGARLGCTITQTPQDRHVITAKLGAFKSSMLQDVEAQRPIELDSIVRAVHEIGLRLGVPVPTIGALLGLTRVFGQVRGIYPAAD